MHIEDILLMYAFLSNISLKKFVGCNTDGAAYTIKYIYIGTIVY